MKTDIIKWAQQDPLAKIPSKETLNHQELIERVSGLDVYSNTPEAYKRAYKALGIDLINRVPLSNAPQPTAQGECRPHPTMPYNYCPLGVYDTGMRHTFLCSTPEDVWAMDVDSLSYHDDLLVPAPHPCKADDIRKRQVAIGNIGQYYPLLYTTLFMWGVEILGWEVFMLAAASESDRFHEHFLIHCVAKSRAIVTEIGQASDSPFIFVHDDLADANGPMFDPTWYQEYIFPHYPEIWSGAKKLSKKIIFVADGNMEKFLPSLIEAGVDGLMFENPATRIDVVIEHFGQPGKFMIGGINTVKLTLGSPEDVRNMVLGVHERTRNCPGFAISSCGGLHGNIPMANIEAYFDARAEVGATPENWRTVCRTD